MWPSQPPHKNSPENSKNTVGALSTNGFNNQKNFAFVDYKDTKNATDAKAGLQGINIRGHRINIEWSKNSGRQEEGGRAPERSAKKKGV